MSYSETRVEEARTLSDIGSWLVKFFEWFGNLALFCGRLIRSAVTPPYEVREVLHQLDELGSKSLPLVALAGELGAMKVTEQVDAMEASAVNPYKYLIATRVLACMLMLPLLTLVTDFFGVLMGWVANTAAEPISLQLFIQAGFKNFTFNDFLPPTLKTMVLGLLIGREQRPSGLARTKRERHANSRSWSMRHPAERLLRRQPGARS